MAYFDYAATTPIKKSVLDKMLPFYTQNFGNSGALHNYGRQAQAGVDQARLSVAKMLNAKMQNIFFTSGATESNNIVFQGLVKEGDHIIVSSIEHPSVLEIAKHFEKKNVEVSYIPVAKEGFVSVEKIKSLVKENTVLVSVMAVNNETGIIQPIQEISELIFDINNLRDKKIYFHTDATQSLAFFEYDTQKYHIDFLSGSAHKLYGPKGIGFLYAKNDSVLNPVYFGGGQEFALRPGTLNIPAIVGLGYACQYVQENRETLFSKVSELKKYFLKSLDDNGITYIVNGELSQSSPHVVNIAFAGVDNQSLLVKLDMDGIAISTGSACSSKSQGASKVLTAMGISDKIKKASIRVSFGEMTTIQEIDTLVSGLKKHV